MGLDQYLYKRTYVKQWEHNGDDNVQTTATIKGKQIPHIKPSRVVYIVEEVMYWRKANQIHNWFVENIQGGEDDCGEYRVSYEQLTELFDTCKTALEAINSSNTQLAEELLPTAAGFFFGPTDYAESYKENVEYTIKELNKILSEDSDSSFYYTSSW